MRIAILGAGAMGSLFGAQLAQAGEDVELIDVSPPQIEAIRSRGLRLETDHADRTVRVKIGEARAAIARERQRLGIAHTIPAKYNN